MAEELHNFISGIPKAELHVHLEGTLEPELRYQLAQRHHIDLKYESPQAIRDAYNFNDLASFLSAYYAALTVLQTEEDFFELAYAYFRRVALENVVYVEAFFDPQAHTSRGVTFATMINGLFMAKERARADFGLQANFIMCFLRDKPESEAMLTLEQALPYKHGILGVGLDSDGFENPPSKFQRVFARARSEGFRLTMHAEFDQKDIGEQLKQCVDLIRVDRIDHGANTIDDPDFAQQVKERGIGLTICPVSTYFINQTYTLKHIRKLLDLGDKVTINSDDPAYFHAYINDNLKVLVDHGGFSKEDILRIVANAFDICWLTRSEKETYLTQVNRYAEKAAAS